MNQTQIDHLKRQCLALLRAQHGLVVTQTLAKKLTLDQLQRIVAILGEKR